MYAHYVYVQGTVKQLLSFTDQEGTPVTLSVGGHFLVAGTDTGYIKMWDLTRRYMYTTVKSNGIRGLGVVFVYKTKYSVPLSVWHIFAWVL